MYNSSQNSLRNRNRAVLGINQTPLQTGSTVLRIMPESPRITAEKIREMQQRNASYIPPSQENPEPLLLKKSISTSPVKQPATSPLGSSSNVSSQSTKVKVREVFSPEYVTNNRSPVGAGKIYASTDDKGDVALKFVSENGNTVDIPGLDSRSARLLIHAMSVNNLPKGELSPSEEIKLNKFIQKIKNNTELETTDVTCIKLDVKGVADSNKKVELVRDTKAEFASTYSPEKITQAKTYSIVNHASGTMGGHIVGLANDAYIAANSSIFKNMSDKLTKDIDAWSKIYKDDSYSAFVRGFGFADAVAATLFRMIPDTVLTVASAIEDAAVVGAKMGVAEREEEGGGIKYLFAEVVPLIKDTILNIPKGIETMATENPAELVGIGITALNPTSLVKSVTKLGKAGKKATDAFNSAKKTADTNKKVNEMTGSKSNPETVAGVFAQKVGNVVTNPINSAKQTAEINIKINDILKSKDLPETVTGVITKQIVQSANKSVKSVVTEKIPTIVKSQFPESDIGKATTSVKNMVGNVQKTVNTVRTKTQPVTSRVSSTIPTTKAVLPRNSTPFNIDVSAMAVARKRAMDAANKPSILSILSTPLSMSADSWKKALDVSNINPHPQFAVKVKPITAEHYEQLFYKQGIPVVEKFVDSLTSKARSSSKHGEGGEYSRIDELLVSNKSKDAKFSDSDFEYTMGSFSPDGLTHIPNKFVVIGDGDKFGTQYARQATITKSSRGGWSVVDEYKRTYIDPASINKATPVISNRDFVSLTGGRALDPSLNTRMIINGVSKIDVDSAPDVRLPLQIPIPPSHQSKLPNTVKNHIADDIIAKPKTTLSKGTKLGVAVLAVASVVLSGVRGFDDIATIGLAPAHIKTPSVRPTIRPSGSSKGLSSKDFEKEELRLNEEMRLHDKIKGAPGVYFIDGKIIDNTHGSSSLSPKEYASKTEELTRKIEKMESDRKNTIRTIQRKEQYLGIPVQSSKDFSRVSTDVLKSKVDSLNQMVNSAKQNYAHEATRLQSKIGTSGYSTSQLQHMNLDKLAEFTHSLRTEAIRTSGVTFKVGYNPELAKSISKKKFSPKSDIAPSYQKDSFISNSRGKSKGDATKSSYRLKQNSHPNTKNIGSSAKPSYQLKQNSHPNAKNIGSSAKIDEGISLKSMASSMSSGSTMGSALSKIISTPVLKNYIGSKSSPKTDSPNMPIPTITPDELVSELSQDSALTQNYIVSISKSTSRVLDVSSDFAKSIANDLAATSDLSASVGVVKSVSDSNTSNLPLSRSTVTTISHTNSTTTTYHGSRPRPFTPNKPTKTTKTTKSKTHKPVPHTTTKQVKKVRLPDLDGESKKKSKKKSSKITLRSYYQRVNWVEDGDDHSWLMFDLPLL